MLFTVWEAEVTAALTRMLGDANISRSSLASGLVVWRLPHGAAVTAGPEDHSGLVYLSFSDDQPGMMIALDDDVTRAARYIAARLARN